MKSIVYFDIEGAKKPFAKIVDTNTQVIFALVALGGEHLTVHSQNASDRLLFTDSDKSKIPGIWDRERVELARTKGFRDPEKHGQYIIHRDSRYLDSFLIPIINLSINSNHYLHSIPDKYKRLTEYIIPVEKTDFSLSIFFTSKLDEAKETEMFNITTSLGLFGFDLQY